MIGGQTQPGPTPGDLGAVGDRTGDSFALRVAEAYQGLAEQYRILGTAGPQALDPFQWAKAHDMGRQIVEQISMQKATQAAQPGTPIPMGEGGRMPLGKPVDTATGMPRSELIRRSGRMTSPGV
jgi:hypothetical protein